MGDIIGEGLYILFIIDYKIDDRFLNIRCTSRLRTIDRILRKKILENSVKSTFRILETRNIIELVMINIHLALDKV